MPAVDFLELPRTPFGNRYVLVVSDYFTKQVEAFTLSNQKSETVARALVDGVLTRHGIPLILYSDQGRNFEGKVIKDLCRLMGMDKVRTTPYHPQCDGLAERMNRSIPRHIKQVLLGSPE
jgi:transposase InsO family protein